MKKAALLLLLLLSGCVTGWPPAVMPSLDEISAHWQSSAQPIKMLGEITLILPNSQYSAEHTLLISPQGEFRLDMFGPFDKRLLTVVCDGRNLLALIYDENRAYVGPATPANLARFVGMELDPRRIYTLLSAQAPFWLSQEQLKQASVLASSTPGEILLLLPQGQSMTFKLAAMQVLEASLLEADGSLIEVVYRWRGQELPTSMELKSGTERALNLYNDSSRYLDYNPRDFMLPQVAPGMEVYTLEP